MFLEMRGLCDVEILISETVPSVRPLSRPARTIPRVSENKFSSPRSFARPRFASGSPADGTSISFRRSFKTGYQNVPSAPSTQQSPGVLGDVYCAACFELMEDMTLQNHVSALNMIENMGGTPEYWEIREGDYY